MGTGASKNEEHGFHGGDGREEENLDQAGGQLYVSLKMENFKLKGDLTPHVYGSVPLVGSWDSSKAVIFLSFYSLIHVPFVFLLSRLVFLLHLSMVFFFLQ